LSHEHRLFNDQVKNIPRVLTQKEYAVIVAGGKGRRFGSDTPKQFVELNGKPVLLHTLEAFFQYSGNITVVLVLPEDDLSTWQEIAKKYHFRRPLIVQTGGASRFHSVKNGLEAIPNTGLVAIHDGVRPLVTTDIIAASFRLAQVHGCAITSVKPKDSIRMDDKSPDGAGSVAVDRSLYRLIQTPQTFNVGLIKKAYSAAEDAELTDDASVAEKAGYPVYLFEGCYENIKITTPEDLLFAQAILNHRSSM
jgi:2-C-methyl-D-erythritol 4-phosphate cytidylyltransferase